MSDQLFLRDINSLRDLRTQWLSYCDTIAQLTTSNDAALKRIRMNLADTERQLKSQLDSAERDYRQAITALNNCHSAGSKDEEDNYQQANCDFEEEQMQGAMQRVKILREKFQSVKALSIKALQAIETYEPARIKFGRQTDESRNNAPYCLQQLIGGAENYIALTIAPAGGNPFSNPFSSPVEPAAQQKPAGEPYIQKQATHKFEPTSFFVAADGRKYEVQNKIVGKEIYQTVLLEGKNIRGGMLVTNRFRIWEQDGKKMGSITDITVPPDYQGRGIGKHLIDSVEKICRDNGCSELTGWADTEGVIPFYKKLGFEFNNPQSSSKFSKKL